MDIQYITDRKPDLTKGQTDSLRRFAHKIATTDVGCIERTNVNANNGSFDEGIGTEHIKFICNVVVLLVRRQSKGFLKSESNFCVLNYIRGTVGHVLHTSYLNVCFTI